MTETIDHDTGEITQLPAVRPAAAPTPYQSAETGQLAEAMAKAQGAMVLDMPKRTKVGKIEGTARGSGRAYSFEYKYAPLEEVFRAVDKPLSENGISKQQGLVTRNGEFFVRTYLRHTSGEWVASDYPVIADKAGAQGFAAGVTYARRYGLSLALGIAAEDDDDGAAAQQSVPEGRPDVRGAPISTKAAVEAKLNSQTAPQPAQPTADALARATYVRIRDEIDAAGTIITLNRTGVFGATAMADEALIDAAAPGAWQKLVDRDAGRRRVLVQGSDDALAYETDNG